MSELINKAKFDEILKSLEESEKLGYETDHGTYEVYYTKDEFDKFVLEMKVKCPDAYGLYNKGKGYEFEPHTRNNKVIPPKMASVASSSRFCYLALKDGLDDFLIVGEPIFEHECRIDGIKGGTAPQFDAYFKESNTYFEVKCHEIFDKHTVRMKEQYRDKVCGRKSDFQLSEECDNDEYVVCGLMMSSDSDTFELPLKQFGINKEYTMFDIKQFLCHLMGIASVQNPNATLIYLFFKPKCSDKNSQKAVEAVFNELKKEITAIFSSYPIQKYCRKHKITLKAWVEESEQMNALNRRNRIVIY